MEEGGAVVDKGRERASVAGAHSASVSGSVHTLLSLSSAVSVKDIFPFCVALSGPPPSPGSAAL